MFWTAIAYSFQPAGLQSMFADLTAEQIKAFASDRAQMRGSAPRMAVAEATGQLAEHLRRLEDMLLDGRKYLLGQQPTIADFSIFHPLWFVRNAKAVAGILDATPAVQAWLDRIAEIGPHEHKKMSADHAVSIARAATPAKIDNSIFLDTHGAALGQRVAIMPSDYAFDPVEGELVLATETEFAVSRNDERAGNVFVHFPRLGFQLKKI